MSNPLSPYPSNLLNGFQCVDNSLSVLRSKSTSRGFRCQTTYLFTTLLARLVEELIGCVYSCFIYSLDLSKELEISNIFFFVQKKRKQKQ